MNKLLLMICGITNVVYSMDSFDQLLQKEFVEFSLPETPQFFEHGIESEIIHNTYSEEIPWPTPLLPLERTFSHKTENLFTDTTLDKTAFIAQLIHNLTSKEEEAASLCPPTHQEDVFDYTQDHALPFSLKTETAAKKKKTQTKKNADPDYISPKRTKTSNRSRPANTPKYIPNKMISASSTLSYLKELIQKKTLSEKEQEMLPSTQTEGLSAFFCYEQNCTLEPYFHEGHTSANSLKHHVVYYARKREQAPKYHCPYCSHRRTIYPSLILAHIKHYHPKEWVALFQVPL